MRVRNKAKQPYRPVIDDQATGECGSAAGTRHTAMRKHPENSATVLVVCLYMARWWWWGHVALALTHRAQRSHKGGVVRGVAGVKATGSTPATARLCLYLELKRRMRAGGGPGGGAGGSELHPVCVTYRAADMALARETVEPSGAWKSRRSQCLFPPNQTSTQNEKAPKSDNSHSAIM